MRGYPSGGDAQFVTLQTEGVPFFPPPTLSFLENSQLIRVDETLDRIEAVRGGTGALFSSGQPGLTINFVQREGRQDFEGLLKLSGTDFGELRADGYVSGPIGPDTTFMVGGYYAASDGIRDPQFTAEKGGQITANVRHDFDKGSLLVFGRYLNDRGQWLLPIPVIQDGKKISGFPGFDAGTGTFAGNETRLGVLNDGTSVDLADGRGADIVNLGANFEYELADDFTVRNRDELAEGQRRHHGHGPRRVDATDRGGICGVARRHDFEPDLHQWRRGGDRCRQPARHPGRHVGGPQGHRGVRQRPRGRMEDGRQHLHDRRLLHRLFVARSLEPRQRPAADRRTQCAPSRPEHEHRERRVAAGDAQRLCRRLVLQRQRRL